MNTADILRLAFEELEGTVTVYGADIDTLNLSKLDDDFTARSVELVLNENGGMVVGVVTDLLPSTFKMVKGDAEVPVVLFRDIVRSAEFPKDASTEFPLPGTGWEFVSVNEGLTDSDDFLKAYEAYHDTQNAVEDAIVLGDDDDAAAAEDTSTPGESGNGVEGADGSGEGVQRPLRDTDVGSRDASVPESGSDGAADGPAGVDPDELETPATINDARVVGKLTPESNAFLAKDATLMLGQMWGERDKRNTQDGDWKNTTLSWSKWLVGGKAVGKGNLPWGLSRHPEVAQKEGPCIILGSSVGGARKAKAMDMMFGMGLDIDSGAHLEDVLKIIQDRGLMCFIYTSFNNGKRGLQLKRDDVLRKLQITTEPTLEDVKLYLRQFDKNRYEPSFIGAITIKDPKLQTASGVVIDLDTPPLEKFRLIFPLAEPVKLVDLHASQTTALEMWEDAVTGLAQNVLEIHFDTACTDPSRLFYTPRHPKGGTDFQAAVVLGNPLVFADIPPYRKSKYLKDRMVATDDWAAQAADADVEQVPDFFAPSGMSLNDWHSKFKERFQITELLETHCPDQTRKTGSEPSGGITTDCPFEAEHSKDGGSGTFAVNALDSTSGYWVWSCRHDACQGRHKLAFLEEALRQEWFPESLLLSDEFVLPPEDEPEEELSPEEPGQAGETVKENRTRTPEERAADFDKDSTEVEIRSFIARLFREGVDMSVQAKVTAKLAEVTSIGKVDLKKMWRTLEKDAAQRKQEADAKKVENFEGSAPITLWDFDKLCGYGRRRLLDSNAKEPTVFHYMENLCVIRDNAEGSTRMKFLDRMGFAHRLNTVATYVRPGNDGEREIGVAAPRDVVDHLFAEDFTMYPALRGIVTTPTFTARGTRLEKPGYDTGSGLFYKEDLTLNVPKVSDAPTDDDVKEAKRLLVEEVFADFPLGGLTRTEIMEQGLNGDGIPALANALALTLLPFMRELVSGPTPGHLVDKPTPGTGASLLTDAISTIALGQPTPATAMPPNKEEMAKTLTSLLANGQSIVYFDNINHSVDSGELAMALTAPTYQARVLGRTQLVEVAVRCVWILTGNNTKFTSELVRRMVMIDLDAKLANPELRTAFRHPNIHSWVTENRGLLVWACLTLIQNWVAKGMIKQNDDVLASYENWSRVVGGVLKEAGIKGFMKNREKLREKAEDNTDGDIVEFLDEWWHQFGSRPIVVRDKDEKNDSLIKLANSYDTMLPLKKVNSDDGLVYDARAFGKMLSRFRGRVFKIGDEGAEFEVLLDAVPGRKKNGTAWQLTAKKSPVSNVSD